MSQSYPNVDTFSDESILFSLISFVLFSFYFTFSDNSPNQTRRVTPEKESQNPTDITTAPDTLIAEHDNRVSQLSILNEIIKNSIIDDMDLDSFNRSPVYNLNLSQLKALYEKQDVSAVDLLHHHHKIQIDDDFRLKVGAGQICMDTTKSMLDYHLTVANCIGLSPILPNANSDHHFSFKMDLKKRKKEFKHKHTMLGFDPTSKMLYLGTRGNEDIYLTMVPNEFLKGHFTPPSPGYSSGSPCMTTCHYCLIVLMIIHFLERISDLPYINDYPLIIVTS